MNSAPLKKDFVRLLAIRMLFQGLSPEEVAHHLLKSRRTIRRWISLWNEGGVDAVLTSAIPGRPRILTSEDKDKVIDLLDHPEQYGESHWTVKKVHGFISKEWSMELGYSTLTHNLKEWGFRLKVPRPWPVQQDEKLREAFRQDLAELLEKDDLEVWFCDETGILGDPRPRRRWMKKGEKGKVPYAGVHLRSNVIGAVNPKTGELFSLIVSHMDSDMFQLFLNQFAKETKERNVILVLDNATWHKAKKLKWRHIEAKYLPPYSPDLNPIERLWLVMKARFFTDWITKEQDELDDRVAEALLSFINNANQVASICNT